MSENLDNNSFGSEKWSFEAEQNWLGFWDLIVKEYIRQNPEEYKKLKELGKNNENNGNTNYSHKT
jgi:hypothetical protein